MNTIKKRALTSIAVCFMACLMFSMPVLAASNSFSKTTVKLNAIDGGGISNSKSFFRKCFRNQS